MDLLELLSAVKAIAAEAGARILDVYRTEFNVTEKDDASPLTAADLASHHAIVSGLERLTPDIPILSEESASSSSFAERRGWPRFWLVDPLDGTKEFIKRNGEFTVNIALIEGHDVVLSVVFVPVQALCYAAAKDLGAWRQQGDQPEQTIRVQTPTAQPLRIVGSRSHAGPSLQSFANAAGEHELVAIGSSLKLCLVAEGQADVYPRLGPTSEWDTAAAQGIVEQAGGQVVQLNGERLRYNTKESLLNPYFLVYGDQYHDWLSYIPADA